MCDPVTAIADVGAEVLTGGAATPFLPLINAGVGTGEGLVKGESFGKALGQGAISGAETLAGQEIGGAVGIGQGNTAFNNALGITGDNPAGTGLPDIGSYFGGSSTPTAGAAIDSSTGMPVSGETTNAAGATVNTASGATVAAPSTPTSVGTPSGGGFSSASSAPDLSANQIGNELYPDSVTSGASTSASPNLGTVGASPSGATTAIGGTPDQIGSVSLNPQAVQSTPPSTGGLKDFLPSKSDVGKFALSSAVPLATLGYEASQGPAPLPAVAQPLGPSGAVTAPLIATETSNLNAANSGNLTAPQQAGIDQWVQDQTNQLIQQLSNSGVTNLQGDSRYREGLAQIQQQALAQKQAMLQQDITNAFSAAGAAGANLGAVANTQVQEDKAYQDALAAAMAAVGGTAGGNIKLTGTA